MINEERDGNGPAFYCMRSTGMHLNAALTLQVGTQACGIEGKCTWTSKFPQHF